MVSVLERLAITSRGFKEEDAVEVAKLIVQVLKDPENTAVHDEVKAVAALTKNIHYITNIRDS